jgi:hypothetical protein
LAHAVEHQSVISAGLVAERAGEPVLAEAGREARGRRADQVGCARGWKLGNSRQRGCAGTDPNRHARSLHRKRRGQGLPRHTQCPEAHWPARRNRERHPVCEFGGGQFHDGTHSDGRRRQVGRMRLWAGYAFGSNPPTDCSRLRARRCRLICPSGGVCEFLSSPPAKNISLPVFRKFVIFFPDPALPRGAYRDRHERWVGCGGREQRD